MSQLVRSLGPNRYCVLLHISQATSLFLAPWAGLAISLGLWLHGRKRLTIIDRHGRSVVNSALTFWLLYVLVSLDPFAEYRLALQVGLLALYAVVILVGLGWAAKGDFWKSPFAFPFLKVTAESHRPVPAAEPR